MPYYLVQARHTRPSRWQRRSRPSRSPGRVNGLAEAVGGRIESLFYCFGEYDALGIGEFPSHAGASLAGAMIQRRRVTNTYSRLPS